MSCSSHRVSGRMRWVIIAGLFAHLLALLVIVGYLGESFSDRIPAKPVALVVPELSEEARAGAHVFDRRCSTCHGRNAGGSDAGPPLVHPIYRSAHHADVAFALAIRRGVHSHHWKFGDMPPQPGLSAREIETIVRYVRELQRANGME